MTGSSVQIRLVALESGGVALRPGRWKVETVAVPLGVIGNTPDSGSGESWFEPRRGNREGWPSGLRRRPAKALGYGPRGFESHSLRVSGSRMSGLGFGSPGPASGEGVRGGPVMAPLTPSPVTFGSNPTPSGVEWMVGPLPDSGADLVGIEPGSVLHGPVTPDVCGTFWTGGRAA